MILIWVNWLTLGLAGETCSINVGLGGWICMFKDHYDGVILTPKLRSTCILRKQDGTEWKLKLDSYYIPSALALPIICSGWYMITCSMK